MGILTCTPLQLAKLFCEADFVKRDAQAAVALCAKNITWFGTGANEDIRGLEQARDYIANEIAENPAPYSMEYLSEQEQIIAAPVGVAMLKLKIASSALVLECRLSISSVCEDGAAKISTLHMSVPTVLQEDNEYYPAAITEELKKKLRDAQKKSQAIVDAIPGGVAIYKVSDVFETTYFSSQVPALSGYTVAEYNELIKGDAAQMTHPDDRQMVVRELRYACQNDTVADFEFRKVHRDGHIVWVHLQGRKIGEEDGFPLIQCVFHNISKLKEDAEVNEHLINSISGGIAVYQLVDGKVKTLRFSEGLRELLGYTDEEYRACVQEDALNNVFVQDRQRLKKDIENTIATQEILRSSCRLIHKNGSLVGVHINAKVVGQENGLPIWYAIFMGMSQESRLYQDIANHSTNGIYVIDKKDHKLLYLNSQLKQTLKEYGTESFVGDACYRVLRHNETPCQDCAVFCGVEAGRPKEVYISHLGKYFSIAFHSIDWEGAPAYVAYISDISEEKRINGEIQRIYNNIPGAVFRCRFDSDWTVISANDGLFEFLGYSREEFVTMGNRMSAVIYPADLKTMMPKISAQLETGKNTVENENRLICKDGTVKWISIKAQMMVDEQDEKFLYCVFVDITKQKQTEEKLLESKESLAISMDHAGVYYWDFDCTRKVAYFSKPVQDLFHIPEVCENFPESFVSLGFVAPAQRQLYIDNVNKIVSGAPYVEFEAQINSAEDSYVWYRLRCTAIRDDDGKVAHAVCTAEPIAQLKDLEMRFTTILEQNQIATWIYNIKQHTLPGSFNLKNTMGFEEAEIHNVPQSLIDKKVVHPDDEQKLWDIYDRLDRGEQRITEVLRLFNPAKQQYRWNRYTYTVIPDKQGRSAYALGSVVDITEQMDIIAKYEAAVESRNKNLAENVLLAGHCNITQNRIEELEDRTGLSLLARFGMQREDFFVGLGTLILSQAQRTEFYKMFLRDGLERNYSIGVVQHSMDCEIRLDEASTMPRWVTVNITVAKSPENNDLIGFLTVSDITDSKMQSQVLDAAIRFDYDYIARLDIDAGAMVMYQSKGIGEQLDNYAYGVTYEYEKALNRTTEKYIIQEDKELYRTNMSIQNLSRQLQQQDVYEFVYRMKEYTGEIRTKRARFVAYDRSSKIIVFSRVDVTKLVEEDAAKKQALAESLAIAQKANKAKSDFLSAMSHDIRTPMNAIIGMCDLAINEQNNAEQVSESLGIIKSSSSLLLSLINDILDMSRIESGKMTLAQEEISISEQLQIAYQRIKLLADKKCITIKTFQNITHDRCVGDEVRIQRIIGNILSNAIKFTPDGGTITCRIAQTASKNKSIGLYRIELSDTGIGMTPEEQAHVFDSFYRADNTLVANTEGTGLGLTIAKSLVDYMGGTISLNSAPGAGTTFIVDLPLRYAQNPAASLNHSQEIRFSAGSFSGVHVLICEDHPVNQKVATRILEKGGITVTIAENGQVGYDKFIASPPNHFQAILMDLQMPVMNGYEATRSIRESDHVQAKSIPILAMTANAFAEDVQKCMEVGMNDHLAKPIEAQTLYATLEKYIDSIPIRQPQKMKVLFVDDAELNIAVLTAALQDEFEMLIARDGEEALRILDANAEIAAMITDIVMPTMDGLTLIRTVRADNRYKNLAIIANTQYGDNKQEEQILQVGADDFLYKPTMSQTVRDRLKSALAKYGRQLM